METIMRTVILTILLLTWNTSQLVAQNGPQCAMRSLQRKTLSERVAESRHVVLAEKISDQPNKPGEEGSTTLKVVAVSKSVDDRISRGALVTLPRIQEGEPGTLFALMSKNLERGWNNSTPATRVYWDYLTQLPGPVQKDVPDSAKAERAVWFLPYLEHALPAIADDAYAELYQLSYSSLVALREELPREKLRNWIQNPNTKRDRLDLYGICLGLAGTQDDVEPLKSIVLNTGPKTRFGLAGAISAYLMLGGNEALDVIEQQRLRKNTYTGPNGEELPIPFPETYAVIQALRNLWNNDPGEISRERLKQCMRLLLDNGAISDLVVNDLARWKDWSVQDRLVKMYNSEDLKIPWTKRSIIRYLLQCSRDVDPDSEELPPHVTSALKHLAALKEQDPENYKKVLIFFPPN